MENGNEYVLISEFAKMVGFSRQTIYKKIDTELKEYIKENNGLKTISVAACKLFDSQATVKRQSIDSQQGDSIDNDFKRLRQSIDSQATTKRQSLDCQATCVDSKIDKRRQSIINNLIDEQQYLHSQIEEKDKTIATLLAQMQEQSKAKDEQIAALHKLLDQQQQLHKAEQEKYLLAGIPEQPKEKISFLRRIFARK